MATTAGTPALPERRAGQAPGPGDERWWHSPTRVLGLFAAWLLSTPWLRPLLVPDEGRYSEVAREMAVGDGLTPTLHGLPFFHKPPLTYWVDMLAMHLVGVNHFAVRMAPTLGAWLMGASLWFALRRWYGVRVAGVGVLILATSPFFFAGAQYANHDMLVAGTLALATFALARSVEQGPPTLGWLIVGWIGCGLAVMAKGLIGIVLPALAIGPWLLLQGRWRDMLRLLHPLALALFALVVVPWHAWMEYRHPGFFDYYVIGQHFRRYAESGFNNPQPFYFFLVVLPVLLLPWSGWLWPLLRHSRPGAWWAARATPAALMGWWALSTLLFFTVPASKLIGYILPALAPLAALLAPLLARRERLWPIALPSALACLALIVYAGWKSPRSASDIAATLRAQREPGDIVVLVDDPFNDLTFDARLDHALVASGWSDPDIAKHDNWRKELADGAAFDPALGRERLYPIDRLADLTCRGHVVWLVARPELKLVVEAVPGAREVQAGRFAQLWRAPPRDCTPASR
jgi:4-amino-4-deoxy-L-arabinose transferase-like glycosyltransferase